MVAVDAPQYPFAADRIAASRKALKWDICLQPVRDISTAVPSIMRANLYSQPSYAFRRDQIMKALGVDLDARQSNFERAALSLVSWTMILAAMQPDFWFRMEDGDRASLPADLWREVEWYCTTYGYALPPR